MKRKPIYFSREEAFQIGYTIVKVVNALEKVNNGYTIHNTTMYFNDKDIEQLKKIYNKLGIGASWEQMFM